VKKSARVVRPSIEALEISKSVRENGSTSGLGKKAIEVKVEFKLRIPRARSVSVAGTFNDWDPKRTPLQNDGERWKTAISLPRGQYEYRFVVDGQWLTDPVATESVPNPFGERNSILSL
jgi:1,4-alpha-glucan branching enzyme